MFGSISVKITPIWAIYFCKETLTKKLTHLKNGIKSVAFKSLYQPTFQLPEPVKFLSALLDYLGNQAQYFASLPPPSVENPDEKAEAMTAVKLENTAMALDSVRHVLTAKQEYCTHCTKHLRLLASFFINKHSSKTVQVNTLHIFGVVAAVQEVTENLRNLTKKNSGIFHKMRMY